MDLGKLEELEQLKIPENMTGMISVMDNSGDNRILWNKDDPANVEIARAAFDAAKAKGYAAHLIKRGKEGEPGEVMHSFDPNAEGMILMAKPQKGG